jgi:hypothetical protein
MPNYLCTPSFHDTQLEAGEVAIDTSLTTVSFTVTPDIANSEPFVLDLMKALIYL